MSEWFLGEPHIAQVLMVPVQERWLCPKEGCDGEMKFTGERWCTNPYGNHHKCAKCEYTAALRGETFPRIVHRPAHEVTDG
jgi:hypothetical protein